MFDKIKMRRGRQWYVNKGNEWFFDEKHDKMNGKIELFLAFFDNLLK